MADKIFNVLRRIVLSVNEASLQRLSILLVLLGLFLMHVGALSWLLLPLLIFAVIIGIVGFVNE